MERLEDLQKSPAPQTQQTSTAAGGGAEDTAMIEQIEKFDYKGAVNKLIEIIHWTVAVLEVALLIRFFFKLLGADPTNLFVGFLYALTDVILILFSTIFRPVMIHPNNVLEWSTLVGMLIIALIYMAVRWLLRIVVSEPEEQAT